MLRPLRKANAETRRFLNKSLKMEARSSLCKLYIYIYIYIYINGFLNVPRTTLQSRQKLLKLLVDCFVDVTLSLRGTNIDRVLI